MTTEQRISSARAALITSRPFFGSLALRLKVAEMRSIPTMAVDGVTLFYNPDFVATLRDDQLQAVIAHEVMHCACLHHTRRGNRDPKRWNVAGDLAINKILHDAGFQLPDDALIDDQYTDMSAEAIYSALHKDDEEQQPEPEPEPEEQDEDEDDGDEDGDDQSGGDEDGDGDDQSDGDGDEDGDGDGTSSGEGGDGEGEAGGDDPGGCGAVMDAPPNAAGEPMSETDKAEEERNWQVAISQAAQLEKACGQMSGGLQRMVDSVLQPKANWRELLRQFMDQVAKQDYSWTPPNRRYVHQGVYLPSMRSEDLPPIVVAVDTSGSVSQDDLDQFAAELTVILEDCKPEALHVVYCDTQVNHVQTFERDDEIELKPYGGGGTSFIPPFEWVEENDVEPVCLIYLTDLESNWFPDEPAYPVLWGKYNSYTNTVPPFGDVIDLD